MPTPPDQSFLSDLIQVLTLRAGFNTTTVILGVTLLGLASGVVGSFALLRKRSLTSDAIAHAMLPGVAAAYLAAEKAAGRKPPRLATDAERVAFLFERYQALISQQPAAKPVKARRRKAADAED